MVTYLKWIAIFEWYVVCCGFKNGYRKGIMSLKEIGMCAQNVITFLGSIVNIIEGDLYGHLMSTRVFTFIKNQMFVCALKFMRKVAMALIWICEPCFTNHVFHILGEVQ